MNKINMKKIIKRMDQNEDLKGRNIKDKDIRLCIKGFVDVITELAFDEQASIKHFGTFKWISQDAGETFTLSFVPDRCLESVIVIDFSGLIKMNT